MPKKIQATPSRFGAQLPCVRITFDELMSLLDRMDVTGDQATATSNGSEFESIEDIKSAPSLFSGEPTIQIKRIDDTGSTACAMISFGNRLTTVSENNYRLDSTQEPQHRDLAILLLEELRPFAGGWEYWLTRARPVLTFFTLAILLVCYFAQIDPGFSLEIKWLDRIIASPITLFLSASAILGSLALEPILNRRMPVTYNPRQTFWQKRGEAAVVGICSSLITGFFAWYLFS